MTLSKWPLPWNKKLLTKVASSVIIKGKNFIKMLYKDEISKFICTDKMGLFLMEKKIGQMIVRLHFGR